MPAPPLPPEAQGSIINTSIHTIEMSMKARVITDAQGKNEKIFLEGDQGVKMEWPGYAFPFIRNGDTVATVTTVVRVGLADAAAPKIILPGTK
jgi:adenylosuccinate synthase